jgi:hypothetical protein
MKNNAQIEGFSSIILCIMYHRFDVRITEDLIPFQSSMAGYPSERIRKE